VDVHLHRARAQVQLAGDLAARVTGGDEASDLDLAPGEPRVAGPGRRDPTQPPIDPLAESCSTFRFASATISAAVIFGSVAIFVASFCG
jgi:hypothetical protein